MNCNAAYGIDKMKWDCGKLLERSAWNCSPLTSFCGSFIMGSDSNSCGDFPCSSWVTCRTSSLYTSAVTSSGMTTPSWDSMSTHFDIPCSNFEDAYHEGKWIEDSMSIYPISFFKHAMCTRQEIKAPTCKSPNKIIVYSPGVLKWMSVLQWFINQSQKPSEVSSYVQCPWRCKRRAVRTVNSVKGFQHTGYQADNQNNIPASYKLRVRS